MQIIIDETTRKARKSWAWTKTNRLRASDVLSVFEELKPWWPITERQLYYRLISSKCLTAPHWQKFGNPERGQVNVYAVIGPLLKWMRIEDLLPWNAVADENRTLTRKRGFTNPEHFIEHELRNFMCGYSRCVAAEQSNWVEIWLEKQALLNIVEPVADEYCRRVMCCRGYNSVTFQADFYQRAEEAKMMGLQPVVLYFGDWDPSGTNMLLAAIQTLQEDLGLNGVEYYRCGINPEHFDQLSADPIPLKQTDTRSKQFIKEHGRTCYELDALHPLQLQELVRGSIRRFTDLEAVSCNLEQEKADLHLLNTLRQRVRSFTREEVERLMQ